MWVARDKDNTLTLFYYKPLRGEGIYAGIWKYDNIDDSKYGDSFMYLPDFMFPELKWEDEPIEVEMIQKNILYGAKHGDKFVTRNGTIVECMTPYNTDNPYMKFRCEGSDWIWSFYKRLNQCNEAYLPKEFECYEDTNIVRKIWDQ